MTKIIGYDEYSFDLDLVFGAKWGSAPANANGSVKADGQDGLPEGEKKPEVRGDEIGRWIMDDDLS